jgi:hypothetical protein
MQRALYSQSVQQDLPDRQNEGKGGPEDTDGLPQRQVRDYQDGVLRDGLLRHNAPPIWYFQKGAAFCRCWIRGPLLTCGGLKDITHRLLQGVLCSNLLAANWLLCQLL